MIGSIVVASLSAGYWQLCCKLAGCGFANHGAILWYVVVGMYGVVGMVWYGILIYLFSTYCCMLSCVVCMVWTVSILEHHSLMFLEIF